ADNRAEIAKLEAEIRALDAAALLAKQSASQAQADKQKREADLAKRALEGKLRAEQLKQEQLAAEAKRRQDEEAETLRLRAAKGEDDKKLADLKAAAEARRKNNPQQQAGDFPTVESAVAEIKRLNARINEIEAGYEKELQNSRIQVGHRYRVLLHKLDSEHQDEFETTAAFEARKRNREGGLCAQRDSELARLTASNFANAETKPLLEQVALLSNREYTISTESISAELGFYNAEQQLFPVVVKSKVPNFKLALNGNLPLSLSEAKAFKQQWIAGLVRPEVKVKAGGDTIEIALANDADNIRFTYFGGSFLTPKMKIERALKQQREREATDQRRSHYGF
ncbi:MAG: hypothetical protein WCI39_00715, partial [Gallionellaceae bacterium]